MTLLLSASPVSPPLPLLPPLRDRTPAPRGRVHSHRTPRRFPCLGLPISRVSFIEAFPRPGPDEKGGVVSQHRIIFTTRHLALFEDVCKCAANSLPPTPLPPCLAPDFVISHSLNLFREMSPFRASELSSSTLSTHRSHDLVFTGARTRWLLASGITQSSSSLSAAQTVASARPLGALACMRLCHSLRSRIG